ncbi:MAG: 50S ribosomal protein L10 [Bacilli bacterium]|nr:50S ribosomal protein L10 [Bacilli bacterium]
MNKEIMASKEAVVSTIVEAVKTSQSFSVVEYRGLTVNQLETLRKELRKEDAELKVFKNTLVSKASEQLGYNELEEVLSGPNAFVISHKDAVSGPKVLSKFAKTNDKLVIKGGVVEGKVVNANELKVIATLPNKEGLLSMLLSCLTSPVRSFACAVKAIADKEQPAE